jgi:hypothetical protein
MPAMMNLGKKINKGGYVMKRCVLILGVVTILILCSLMIVVETAQAGWGWCDETFKVDCRIEGGKKVGDSNFTTCYDWGKMGCVPCHGFAHLAKWCNEHFSKCNGKCWGCYTEYHYIHDDKYVCRDKHGHKHDPK